MLYPLLQLHMAAPAALEQELDSALVLYPLLQLHLAAPAAPVSALACHLRGSAAGAQLLHWCRRRLALHSQGLMLVHTSWTTQAGRPFRHLLKLELHLELHMPAQLGVICRQSQP